MLSVSSRNIEDELFAVYLRRITDIKREFVYSLSNNLNNNVSLGEHRYMRYFAAKFM